MGRARASGSNTQSSQRSTQVDSSQRTLEETLTPMDINIEEVTNDCVRFMVIRAGHQVPFRKPEILKNILPKHIKNFPARMFETVIKNSIRILYDVYGYNIIQCNDKGHAYTYYVSNTLSFLTQENNQNNVNQEHNIPEDNKKILLLLILGHIFMSNGSVNEAALYTFLKSFEIYHDRSNHEVFGNVKEYLTHTLIKQKYIEVVKDSISGKLTFTWGQRAEREISKLEILQFVCKMYKDTKPKNWTDQYKVASTQACERRPTNVENMEVDQETEEADDDEE